MVMELSEKKVLHNIDIMTLHIACSQCSGLCLCTCRYVCTMSMYNAAHYIML